MFAAPHAFAGSAASDAYVSLAAQDLEALTASNRLAADRATSDAIKSFARSSLQAPVPARPAVADAGVPTVVAAAMDGATTVEAGGVQTARSAQVDPVVDPTVFRAPLGTGVQMPTAPTAQAYLETQQGPAFDWAYKAVQQTLLTDLRGLEAAYSQTGDDPALRAAAAEQLPEIDARLAALRAL